MDLDDEMDQIQLRPFTLDTMNERDDSLRCSRRDSQFISRTPVQLKEGSMSRSPTKKQLLKLPGMAKHRSARAKNEGARSKERSCRMSKISEEQMSNTLTAHSGTY